MKTEYAVRRTTREGCETVGVVPTLDHGQTYIRLAVKYGSEEGDVYDILQRTISEWTPLATTPKETT